MLRILEYIVLAIGVAAIIGFSYWLGQQAYDWVPIAASTDADRIDRLFSFLVWMSAIIFLGIVGMIAYSVLTCRAPKGDFREGHATRGNGWIEAAWTITPIVLVLWISGYSFYIYAQMDITGPTQLLGEAPVTWQVQPAVAQTSSPLPLLPENIEVIARQWVWTFRYPAQNITSNELHLPVNRQIHLLLRSQDVIHGFYVPEFRFKQDIIPNRPIDIQFTPTRVGAYQLQDSSFSGDYFALMQTKVFVETPEAYASWLSQAARQTVTTVTNPAAAEHAQPPKRVFQTSLSGVTPAQSTAVNYASQPSTSLQASVQNYGPKRSMGLSQKEGES